MFNIMDEALSYLKKAEDASSLTRGNRAPMEFFDEIMFDGEEVQEIFANSLFGETPKKNELDPETRLASLNKQLAALDSRFEDLIKDIEGLKKSLAIFDIGFMKPTAETKLAKDFMSLLDADEINKEFQQARNKLLQQIADVKKEIESDTKRVLCDKPIYFTCNNGRTLGLNKVELTRLSTKDNWTLILHWSDSEPTTSEVFKRDSGTSTVLFHIADVRHAFNKCIAFKCLGIKCIEKGKTVFKVSWIDGEITPVTGAKNDLEALIGALVVYFFNGDASYANHIKKQIGIDQ